jgi:hypothetical protein
MTGHTDKACIEDVAAIGKVYMRCANHPGTPVAREQVPSINADITKFLELKLIAQT